MIQLQKSNQAGIGLDRENLPFRPYELRPEQAEIPPVRADIYKGHARSQQRVEQPRFLGLIATRETHFASDTVT